MATKNTRVAAYLPPDIEQAFKVFKAERGLGESKALIAILAEYFGVNQEVVHPSSLDLIKRIEALEAEVFKPASKSTQAVGKAQSRTLETKTPLLFGESKSDLLHDSPPAVADGERWLTGPQALQVALRRGYVETQTRFTLWARRKPNKCLEELGLRRFDSQLRGSRATPIFEDMQYGTDQEVEF